MGRAATAQANLKHLTDLPSFKGAKYYWNAGLNSKVVPGNSCVGQAPRLSPSIFDRRGPRQARAPVVHSYPSNSGGSPFIIFPNFRAPKPFENVRIIFFI